MHRLPANDYRKVHTLFPVYTYEKFKFSGWIIIVFEPVGKSEKGKCCFFTQYGIVSINGTVTECNLQGLTKK